MPEKLNFSLDLGDEFKLICFQPGESYLAFDWLDFTQLFFNLKIECAPSRAWKKLIYLCHLISI